MKLGHRIPEHRKLPLLEDLRLINQCLEVERLVHARDNDGLRKFLLSLQNAAHGQQDVACEREDA